MKRAFLAFCGIAMLASTADLARAAAVYSVDNGTNSGGGVTGLNATVTWLNGFQSIAGATQIGAIRIAFGSANPVVPANGQAITLLLWTDPNNDGNPVEAVVASSFAGVVSSTNTNTFVEFLLPASVTVAAGNWFYAGFAVSNLTGEAGGPFRDTDASATAGTQSWYVNWGASAPTFSNLNSTGALTNLDQQNIFGGNFMIRAVGGEADQSGVPEPTSFALGGIGLIAIAAIRRNRIR